MLKNKNVVVGVTGGIAAYKVCDVVSKLKKLGANVDVIMTKSAMEFISPHTFQALSQNPVITNMFETPRYWEIEHISLAQKADIILIAPATANIIGKIANGIADDMLSTTIMASTARIIFAPAMNTKMYENQVVQQNIGRLKELGYNLIEPNSGRLACGDVGKGKLADVDEIIYHLIKAASPEEDFKGKKVLITAGPTKEAIDPVRYITNHSSGKMGYALAEAAVNRGAEVTLVTGPTQIPFPKECKVIPVNTTLEMYEKVMEVFRDQDIIIKAAAVADYRPESVSSEKIKKGKGNLTLTLVRNPDILKELGKIKGKKILVGFAAESRAVIENAKGKVERKNLDFIVANDITQEGAGFGQDTNIVHFIDKYGDVETLEKMTKHDLSDRILDKVKKFMV